MVDGHYTAGTWFCWEIVELGESSALILQADELEAGSKLARRSRRSDGHPESWFEGGNLLVAVGRKILLGIVYSHL